MASVGLTKGLKAEIREQVTKLLERRRQIMLKPVDKLITTERVVNACFTPEQIAADKIVVAANEGITCASNSTIQFTAKECLQTQKTVSVEGYETCLGANYFTNCLEIPKDTELYREILWQRGVESSFNLALNYQRTFVEEFLGARTSLGAVRRDWPELLTLLGEGGNEKLRKLGSTVARGSQQVEAEDALTIRHITEALMEGMLLNDCDLKDYTAF